VRLNPAFLILVALPKWNVENFTIWASVKPFYTDMRGEAQLMFELAINCIS